MMVRITLIVLATLAWAIPTFSQFCDETGSYNKTWTLQSRFQESKREERKQYLETLTQEQKERISDLDVYPTDAMTCGMGFSNGLGKIFVNGKAGFINTRGEIVIKPQYNDAGRFSDNLAPVELGNGKWGYINKKGEIVIKPNFDWALVFLEGKALIQVGKKWGFIDSRGKMVVTPRFDHANSFSEGLAHVQIYREKYFSGYIDKTGKWVIQPIFNGGGDFLDGKSIADQNVVDEKGNYKYTECYQIDRLGRKLKEVECSGTRRHSNLLDSTHINIFFEGYKTGYMGKNGRVIWKPTK